MKLYIIATKIQKDIVDLFVKACDERGVKYEILDPANTCPLDIKIRKGDAVYRAATSDVYGAAELELDLVLKGAKSFHKDSKTLFPKQGDTILYETLGIPAPKTISYIPKNRAALLKCVDALGGFPVCLKALCRCIPTRLSRGFAAHISRPEVCSRET